MTEYVEKTKYLFGIIPTKKETARGSFRNPDVEIRRRNLSEKGVLSVQVNSENVIEVFRYDSHSKVLKQDAINKKNIRVRTSLISTIGYKWKKR